MAPCCHLHCGNWWLDRVNLVEDFREKSERRMYMLALSSFAAGNQMLRSLINTSYLTANLIRVLAQDIKVKTRCLAGSVQSSLPRTGL